MDKCDQSLSDEWVPQGSEAQKCITLHPAFNTACLDRWSDHCVWHLGSTEPLIKKVISKLVQNDAGIQATLYLMMFYNVLTFSHKINVFLNLETISKFLQAHEKCGIS